MRGKDSAAPALALGQGITPAHAGKSIRSVLPRKCCRDHPRTCGEKFCMVATPLSAWGITPAHAGKRMSAKPCASRFQDHPRTCGEKWLTSGCWSPSQGSPPHMRGKVSKYAAKPADYRITPAHAGKSASLCSCAWLPGDHPRTCGEKSALPGPAIAVQGSPPHMRGKGIDRSAHTDKSGITPAHAGKRCTCCYACPLHTDHPRTCGEKCYP